MRKLNKNDCNLYLEQGAMSKFFLDKDCLVEKIMLDYNAHLKNGKPANLISSLINYLLHKVKPADGESEFAKMKFTCTASEIWESGKSSGCTDRALLFATCARTIGLPATLLHTASEKWIKKLESGEDISVASRSLSDDFACIINTYVPRYKTNPGKVSPENNIDCPLGELGLVDIFAKKTYKKSIPAANSFDPWIVLAIISDQANGRQEIGLNELLTAKCNIGRIFNLDAITMIEVLRRVEKMGEIKIIRTAGLDVVHLKNEHTFQECVENYYANL